MWFCLLYYRNVDVNVNKYLWFFKLNIVCRNLYINRKFCLVMVKYLVIILYKYFLKL